MSEAIEDKFLIAVAGYINQGYDLEAARRLAQFDQAYEKYKTKHIHCERDQQREK